jgi:hypothetical protein
MHGLAWAHILREIKREKAHRHHELLMIERRNKILEERTRQIDRAKYELDVREARCLEVEPFLRGQVVARFENRSRGSHAMA